MRITCVGKVTIEAGRIMVEGFEAENASCRDIVVLAAAWALGELQREMLKTIERPGGGNLLIREPDEEPEF
ncbi:hypothetical protein ACX3YG_14420 [Pseudomonas wadenswilerensis]